MRISSSVALCATIILQAICGYTVAETTGEEPGGNLRAGGAGGAGTGGMGGMRIGGDGRNAISATTFLQQAYRIQELQVEFHSRYSLIRCEYNYYVSIRWGKERHNQETDSKGSIVTNASNHNNLAM